MDKLHIEPTKSTPEINFDPINHVLSIQGQSYPENAFQFYQPILQWLDDYLKELRFDIEVRMDFTMPYINTSSSKCIFMVLDKLAEAHSLGAKVVVNWYYDEDNESELECAQEFQEDIDVEFHLVPRRP